MAFTELKKAFVQVPGLGQVLRQMVMYGQVDLAELVRIMVPTDLIFHEVANE